MTASAPEPAAVTRRWRWPLRLAAVLALLAIAWTLAVGWWLPRFLQPRVEAAAASTLGAPLTLERIEIAPWTLQARALGLRLGPADKPWLRVAAVDADVSVESLWRLAPVLHRLTVRAPQVELERLAPGRFNITPMLEALARRPPAPPDSEPARFAVYNILLEDGGVHFADRVTGGEHRIAGLRVGIPFVSSLPSQATIDVEPLLDAQVDGSRFHLEGRTLPFSEGLRSAVDLQWQQIDVAPAVAALAPLLPQALPLAVQQGRLDLALKIAFERRPAPATPALRISGGATLSQLQASVPAQGLQLAWTRLALDGLDLLPLQRRATVGTVTLDAPALDLDLTRLLAAPATQAGALPARRTGASASAPTASAPATEASKAGKATNAWQWHVARVAVNDGRLRLREPAWPDGQVLAPIQATLTAVDASASEPAHFKLALADARGARATLDGSFAFATRRLAAAVDVTGLQAAPWTAPWQAALPVRLLGGSLALQARAEADPAGWLLQDGAIQVAGLQLAPAAKAATARGAAPDRLALAKASASGVQLKAAEGAPIVTTVGAVRLDGLDLKASRGAGGVMPWLPLPPAGAAPVAHAAVQTPTPAWQIGELRCSACAVTLSDRSTEPVTTLAVTRTELTLHGLGSDLKKPVTFDVAATVGRGGRARLRGSVRPQPLALRSRVDLAAVDLSLLQPYIDPYVNLTLVAAKASAAGELRLAGTARETVTSARWQGRLALGDLHALDRLNAAEFLRFRNLGLDGADIAWQGGSYQADLGSVALDDFYGRVILNRDGRLNLRDIVKRGGTEEAQSLTTPAAAGAPAAAAASPAAPASAAAAAPTPLRWRGIHLSGGEVDFTDNFIRPNYSARLTGVTGDISALAWNDPKPAEVHVAGKVDDSAPLEIAGTIHPLGARLHTDITATARGIDMTRLSAYAARYAGYGIDKGTLSAKVHYRIDDGKLEADNSLYLDQLSFGAKVDSPDALKVPVLLAVALLKDRNGVIDIDLPISGSLDDPQFSLGGIIVRVIVNLIVKAVTAPFTLLSHVFGGGHQELSYVAFDPGSSVIAEATKPALDTLAKALADRPALKLEITGRADPAEDVPALQHAYVERLLRLAKARATHAPPDTVTIAPDERARWLEAAYKAADLKDKPRNALGLQKTLPAAEMEARLLQSAPADAEALKAVADARADDVKAYLALKVPSERLLVTASRLDAAGIDDKGRTTRVGFALK